MRMWESLLLLLLLMIVFVFFMRMRNSERGACDAGEDVVCVGRRRIQRKRRRAVDVLNGGQVLGCVVKRWLEV